MREVRVVAARRVVRRCILCVLVVGGSVEFCGRLVECQLLRVLIVWWYGLRVWSYGIDFSVGWAWDIYRLSAIPELRRSLAILRLRFQQLKMKRTLIALLIKQRHASADNCHSLRKSPSTILILDANFVKRKKPRRLILCYRTLDWTQPKQSPIQSQPDLSKRVICLEYLSLTWRSCI